jgi:hypothetical protein
MVEDGLCLPEVPEVMRCVLLCKLEAVEELAQFAGGVVGGVASLSFFELLELTRCVLEVLECWSFLELLEAMRFVLLCRL